MKIVENYSLHTHSAMRTGGTARYAASLETVQDVQKLATFAQKNNLPLHVIGEGTNTFFGDGVLPIVVGNMCLRGITILEETSTQSVVNVAAGEVWDELVAWSVTRNLSGIEALSLIPGTVGAAPIQNIGAYGREFKDVCHSVTVYDCASAEIRTLSRDECHFAYRDSIFKQRPGVYVVLGVTIILSKASPEMPTYKDVVEYFGNETAPTVAAIREAICTIRMRKLPDYKTTPNLGSFFKNPIIDAAAFAALTSTHGEVPHAPLLDGQIKLFAGWLIEQCGLKGAAVAGLIVYEKNALVLTNPQRLSYTSVRNAEELIRTAVRERFGVTLEREPILIS
ncbi:MAG: UDP-N-acetylenolpyruvoylglucosamine reductase [Candidatus Parcubacteria bacterium]|jgi:UDP-N-acetylmuramate dehydrogenase